MQLELNKQLFLINEPQSSSDWINFCEFNILGNSTNFDIIDFFKSEYYRSDFLSLKIKKNKEIDYPRPLFKGELLESSHFKVYTKTQLDEFLLNYTADISYWGENFHNNFIEIYNKIRPHLKSLIQCYLIDRENYDLDSKIVTNSILFYDYYLLFVWIDTLENKFYCCEWASD